MDIEEISLYFTGPVGRFPHFPKRGCDRRGGGGGRGGYRCGCAKNRLVAPICSSCQVPSVSRIKCCLLPGINHDRFSLRVKGQLLVMKEIENDYGDSKSRAKEKQLPLSSDWSKKNLEDGVKIVFGNLNEVQCLLDVFCPACWEGS